MLCAHLVTLSSCASPSYAYTSSLPPQTALCPAAVVEGTKEKMQAKFGEVIRIQRSNTRRGTERTRLLHRLGIVKNHLEVNRPFSSATSELESMSPRCYYQGSGFFACAHAKTLGQDDLCLLRLFLRPSPRCLQPSLNRLPSATPRPQVASRRLTHTTGAWHTHTWQETQIKTNSHHQSTVAS